MERATGTEVYGCGSPQSTDITLNIQTTTGGNFSISVNGKNTVEHLKRLVSRKLKVSKDRICLLHRERQLRDGTLEENGLMDGSRVVLLPSVETGLLSQRPENSVMQALESLNDTQVNDFLSGKSPLNLTMRLGDNMMLIQLQLSTLNSGSGSSKSHRTSTQTKSSTSSIHLKPNTRESPSPHSSADKFTHNDDNSLDSDDVRSEKPCLIRKHELELLQSAFDLYRSMTEEKQTEKSETIDNKDETVESVNDSFLDQSVSSVDSDQSPIKSLSNLVSSPIDASTSENRRAIANSVKNSLLDLLAKSKTDDPVPSTSGSCEKVNPPVSSATPDSSISDDSDHFTDQSSFLAENTIDEYPMEHLFNSAVDKGLFEEQDESMVDREISNLATTSHGAQESTGNLPSFQSIAEPLKNKRFQLLLHKTSKFKHPIGQNKQRAFMQSVVNKHKKRMQVWQDNNSAQPSTSRADPYITNSRKLILQPSNEQTEDLAIPSTSKQTPFIAPEAPNKPERASQSPPVDTKALIEASKNLTQKLKKLSKEVLTNKVDLRTAHESVSSKIGSGAVIESMKHHGKGIYSGTFSGTLNPSLQDRHGRPKRDISTIIHILNDLLCAGPPPVAVAPKDTKTAEEAAAGRCPGCSRPAPACARGQCAGHAPAAAPAPAPAPASASAAAACACAAAAAAAACACARLERDACAACAACASPSQQAAGELCKKCDTAKTLAMENSKTKCKLEQLRLVMQQKKQRREERKLKTMPYAAGSPAKAITKSPEPAKMQDEIETVA